MKCVYHSQYSPKTRQSKQIPCFIMPKNTKLKFQSTTLDRRLLQCPTKQGNYKINATFIISTEKISWEEGRREREGERKEEALTAACVLEYRQKQRVLCCSIIIIIFP